MKRHGKRSEALKHSHDDGVGSREVWIEAGIKGTESLTLCGHYLPCWEDGEDGLANRERWAIRTGKPITCPNCLHLNGELTEEEKDIAFLKRLKELHKEDPQKAKMALDEYMKAD